VLGGPFVAITWIGGRRFQESLKTDKRAEAKRLAEAFLLNLHKHDEAPQQPVNVEQLWNRYREGSAPYLENKKTTQVQKGSSVRRLIAFFGSKHVADITPNDIERFSHARRTGLRVRGVTLGAVRENAVRHDLAVLRTMILWATHERRGDKSFLLTENPLR
jgi:hypothetical protein